MGTETEYGISVPGDPGANPIVLSAHVVSAYAAAHGIRPRRAAWDYYGEDPLADARGWTLQRWQADDSQLTDDPTTTNIVLTNGARFYVDHAHPEYSSPEVTNPLGAVRWDRAGDVVALESVRLLADAPGLPAVNLYRNNTDGKGASYGSHENYLTSRQVPFADIAAALIPFFVARQVLCGAGRVGIGQDSRLPAYQISQRADFFETRIGLETTLRRPIVNTRDEPHAHHELYRRLHVIVGDANTFDVPNLLKTGLTSLVLALVENGRVPAGLELADPVTAMHDFSHDVSLRATAPTEDGRRVSALDILRSYLEAIEGLLADPPAPDPIPDQTRLVVDLAHDLTDRLATDPAQCARELEWVAKLELLQGYRERDGLDWSHPRLAAIDIQWADIRPEKGIARQLEARGRVRRLVDEASVVAAASTPPTDTRAWFRGECLRRYGDAVAAASWDSVVFDDPAHAEYQRVPLLEPEQGTRSQLADLLDACPDVHTLLTRLATDPA